MIPTFFINSFGVEIRQVFSCCNFALRSFITYKRKCKKIINIFTLAVLSHYSAIFAVIIIFILYGLFKLLKTKNLILELVGALIFLTLFLLMV